MLLSTLNKFILPFLASTVSSAALKRQSSSNASECTQINTTFTQDSYRSELLTNYLAMWGGNYSLIPEVLSPDVSLYQDILPIGPIPIHNTTAYQKWIEHSRYGYSKFEIDTWFWFGSDFQIALRWHLDAIIQDVQFHAPGSSLPPGSPIAYNGTDIINVNPCTGLIDEVASAQDFLTYFHALGLKEISV